MREFTGIESGMDHGGKIAANLRNRGKDVSDLSADAAFLATRVLQALGHNEDEAGHAEIGRALVDLCRGKPDLIACFRAFERQAAEDPIPPHADLRRLLHYMGEKAYPHSTENAELFELARAGRETNPDRYSVCDAELAALFPNMDRSTRRRLAVDYAKVPFAKTKTGPKPRGKRGKTP